MRTSSSKGWADNMKNLLKLEFRKLKRQKSFYICTAIMIALLLLSAVTTNALIKTVPAFAGQLDRSGIDSMITALSNSSFTLIVSIFTALTVCEDYEQQTVKNIFAKGYSRKIVYFAKMISVWISTSIMFVIVVLASLGFGTIFFGIEEPGDLKFLGIIAVQYVTAMANVALFFAISSTLRKNGSSIAAAIIAPMLMNIVLTLLDSFLRLENFSTASIWISSFLGDLSTQAISSERLLFCLAASLAYILLFAFAGLQFNKKFEL